MDQKLLFFINHEQTSPALDSFMATLSCFAAWVPLLILLLAITWIYGEFKARSMLLVLALVIGISDVLISDTLKRAVHRPRPREALDGVRVIDLQPSPLRFLSVFKTPVVELSHPSAGLLQGHSFPSGHTVNNFSAATVLTLFYRRRGWLYFIPASLIAYARVYVGAHWPSDVIVSAFLAVGTTLLMLAIIETAWRRYGRHWMPKTHARHPGLWEDAK